MKLNKLIRLIAVSAAILLSMSFVACGAGTGDSSNKPSVPEASVPAPEIPDSGSDGENTPQEPSLPPAPSIPQPPPDIPETPEIPQEPPINRDLMFAVTATSLKVRSGAGSSYSVVGSMEKGALIKVIDMENNWYRVKYRNKIAYVSASSTYGKLIYMDKSDNAEIESVIDTAMKLYGLPYVLGAQRLHWGNGVMNTAFTGDTYDCSSFTQYAYYYGADVILGVTTRDQVQQGVKASFENKRRGDLLFFTNASRVNKVGLERVGHVAIYLGQNYILHTASDFALIETISSTRESYFIEGRRFL